MGSGSRRRTHSDLPPPDGSQPHGAGRPGLHSHAPRSAVALPTRSADRPPQVPAGARRDRGFRSASRCPGLLAMLFLAGVVVVYDGYLPRVMPFMPATWPVQVGALLVLYLFINGCVLILVDAPETRPGRSAGAQHRESGGHRPAGLARRGAVPREPLGRRVHDVQQPADRGPADEPLPVPTAACPDEPGRSGHRRSVFRPKARTLGARTRTGHLARLATALGRGTRGQHQLRA